MHSIWRRISVLENKKTHFQRWIHGKHRHEIHNNIKHQHRQEKSTIMLRSIFSKYSHFNQETYQGISIIRRWSFISRFSELKFTLTIKQPSTFIQYFQYQASSSTLSGKYAQWTCLVRCI